jgi:beta-glucosidase
MACVSSTKDPLPYTSGYVADPATRAAATTMANSLTDAEKAQQMRGLPQTGTANYNVFKQEDNAAKGIKAFYFRDGPRGVNLNANGDGKNDYSTAFPVAIARGAAFDVDLEYHTGQAVGDETLVSGNTMILAPTVNILRHPAWGRAQETYGEDPFLLGRLGSAFTIGVQEYIAACAKHYAANNIENGRQTATAVMDEQTLHEIYARHFEMIVKEGGVSSIMAAYNLIQTTGQALHATQSAHLMNDLLRTEFGFEGFVLTDWWAMPNGNSVPLPATNVLQTSAVQAVNGGLDMELPWSYNYSTLPAAVTSGALTSVQLAKSAARIIEQKMRFKVDKMNGAIGLKTPTTTYNTGTASIENDASHIAIALQGAVESMVLLKNEKSTLPISRTTVKNIAVLGAKVSFSAGVMSPDNGMIDFSTNVRTGDVGSSRVFSDPAKSAGPFAGIKAAAGAGITVTAGNSASVAANADFIVVVAGLTPQDEGEEYTKAGDRPSFALDAKANNGVQNALITAAAALNKPMVVVLEGGSVIDMPWLASVPAVVMAWYPGMVGGTALGKLLFGDSNFSGKLPLTWPKAFADEPVFANSSGITTMDYYLGYRWFDNKGTAPLYPFGYGLSYTTFTYSNLQVPCSTVPKDGVVNVQVDVTNTTPKQGDEVVFLFVSYPGTKARRPVKELKGFARVAVAGMATQHVTIPLRVADLKYWDSTMSKWVVESGQVKVMVGGSSAALPLNDTFMVN